MECQVCLNRFDSEVRRPKSLPCGHTHCLPCLQSMKVRRCSECNKAFQSPMNLPDNFAVLSLVDKVGQADLEQDPGPLLVRLQDAEAVCSNRIETIKSRLQETLPRVLKESLLRLSPKNVQIGGVRAVLEAANHKTVVELDQARGLGHALKLAGQALATHEAMLAVSELVGDGGTVSLVLDLDTGVRLRGRGSRVAVQQAVTAVHLLLDGGLEADGSAESPPASGASGSGSSETSPLTNDPGHGVHSIAAAAVPVRKLTVGDLSQTHPQDRSDEKEEVLQRVRPAGVRTLTGVHCNKDPDWTMELLRCVKPAVERLHLKSPLPMHLEEAFAMPKLRTLSVCGGDTLFEGTQPLIALEQPSSLQTLALYGTNGVPRETVQSLLRRHGATLRDVCLQVGVTGNELWPKNCEDLDSLVEPLTKLSTLVLYRNCMHHVPKRCKDQLTKVRGKVRSAIVLCRECDRDKIPKKWKWFA